MVVFFVCVWAESALLRLFTRQMHFAGRYLLTNILDVFNLHGFFVLKPTESHRLNFVSRKEMFQEKVF